MWLLERKSRREPNFGVKKFKGSNRLVLTIYSGDNKPVSLVLNNLKQLRNIENFSKPFRTGDVKKAFLKEPDGIAHFRGWKITYYLKPLFTKKMILLVGDAGKSSVRVEWVKMKIDGATVIYWEDASLVPEYVREFVKYEGDPESRVKTKFTKMD